MKVETNRRIFCLCPWL